MVLHGLSLYHGFINRLWYNIYFYCIFPRNEMTGYEIFSVKYRTPQKRNDAVYILYLYLSTLYMSDAQILKMDIHIIYKLSYQLIKAIVFYSRQYTSNYLFIYTYKSFIHIISRLCDNRYEYKMSLMYLRRHQIGVTGRNAHFIL